MSERIVFLDRASLPVRFTRPRCTGEYREHAETAPAEVVARLAGASVAITNKVPLGGAVLAELPKLKLIAVAATGYDCVDIAACRERGIVVVNIRQYAVHTVPEHVFALVLALRRNLVGYRAAVAAGTWQKARQFCVFDGEIRDLHGSVLGVVGHGSIGSAVAAIGAAFGMKVLYSTDPEHPAVDAQHRPLAELIATSDVLTLHCPLTVETRGLIGEQQLRSMKRGAILINTARGGLVDEQALRRALTEGWIGGAGFDVLTVEPPRDGHALLELNLPNFILTPHVAWASIEAMEGLADQLTYHIDAWADGAPRNVVT
jgi:glycerate dehydrogenase